MMDCPALVPVPIESFRNVTRDIGFDVFLKLSEQNVAHVFSKTTGLDYKRLAHYIQKGVTHLYIREGDMGVYQAVVAKPITDIISDPASPSERKIAALLNMTEQNMAEIFSQFAVRQETVADTRKLVSNYVELMGENPQTLALILKLVSHGEYLYYHSIAVSIFSLFIAKATGIFDRKTIEITGFGGFLHDIGSTQLPPEIMSSPDIFGPTEWEQMKRHPKIGLDMLERCAQLPEEVRYIIYQHHEEPSGNGYPNEIPGTKVYYPAHIVHLADAFSALISKRPHQPAHTPEQAIEMLRAKPSRFDRHLVDLLASIISRKPAASDPQQDSGSKKAS